MSFFPTGFDARADVVGALDLVDIETTEGTFGFLLGIDGRFVDVNGKTWWGSTLLKAGDLELSIAGAAPSGTLTFAYFQDPEADDLIAQMKAAGRDYVAGRSATFYIQPLMSMQDFWAPQVAPCRLAARTMTSIGYALAGPLERSITVAFETPFAGRNVARGLTYTTTDHARLIGAANSSLRFMPTDTYQEQKLFG